VFFTGVSYVLKVNCFLSTTLILDIMTFAFTLRIGDDGP
jgi:hypothetical protein